MTMKLLALLVVGAIFSIPLVMYSGLVLTLLWGWFAAPLFHLPQLTLASAIGISVLVSFLTSHSSYKKMPEDEDWLKVFFRAYVSDLVNITFALCVGWVVHLFM